MSNTKPKRLTRKPIWILTEGEVTEPSFIENVIQWDEDKFSVQVDGSIKSPSAMVDEAIRRVENDRNSWDESRQGQVWVVFDRDNWPDIGNLIKKARARGVNVAFSAPCFEYWLLLHFGQSTKPYVNDSKQCKRDLAQKGLKHLVPSFVDYQGKWAAAQKAAQRVRSSHHGMTDKQPWAGEDPYTDFDKLVESIAGTY